nr:vegetative cell wall protein gp1-like [Aegilops tauschii subsp. strangulata]
MPPPSHNASSSSATPRAQPSLRSAALLRPCLRTRLLRPRAVWSPGSSSASRARPQSASPGSLASARLSRLAVAALGLLPACRLPACRLRPPPGRPGRLPDPHIASRHPLARVPARPPAAGVPVRPAAVAPASRPRACGPPGHPRALPVGSSLAAPRASASATSSRPRASVADSPARRVAAAPPLRPPRPTVGWVAPVVGCLRPAKRPAFPASGSSTRLPALPRVPAPGPPRRVGWLCLGPRPGARRPQPAPPSARAPGRLRRLRPLHGSTSACAAPARGRRLQHPARRSASGRSRRPSQPLLSGFPPGCKERRIR